MCSHICTQIYVWCSFARCFSGSRAQALGAEGNRSMGAREMQVRSFSLHQEGSSAPYILPWQLSSATLPCTSVWEGMRSRGTVDLAGCLRAMEPSQEHSRSSVTHGNDSHPQPPAPRSKVCKLRARSSTMILPGLQTPSLGGRATGLPCAARAKEGQRILTILTRAGVDQRTRCNLKTKGWATGQLRFEHTIEGEVPPRAVLAQKWEGTARRPSGSSYRAQPHYSCQQLSWVYTTALHFFGWKAWAWDRLMKATWKRLFMFRVSYCTGWDQITRFK